MIQRLDVRVGAAALLIAVLLSGCGRSASAEDPAAAPASPTPTGSATSFPTSTYVPTAAPYPRDLLVNAMLNTEDFDKVFNSTHFAPPKLWAVKEFYDGTRESWRAARVTPEACFPVFAKGVTSTEASLEDTTRIATSSAVPRSNSKTMVITNGRIFSTPVEAADFVKALNSQTAGCTDYTMQFDSTTRTFSSSDASDYGVEGLQWTVRDTTKATSSEVFIMSHGSIVLFFEAHSSDGAEFPPEDLRTLLSLQQAKLRK